MKRPSPFLAGVLACAALPPLCMKENVRSHPAAGILTVQVFSPD
jgi:hypothetical protein